MKLSFFALRPQTPIELKAPARPGPTVIHPQDFKHIGGGSPKGTWGAATTPTSPKGTW